MNYRNIRWGAALGGVLASEAALVAAAFAWVAVYSHVLHPGETLAYYQEYAIAASPYVSLLLGVPVFYAACRWAGRRAPSAARATAFALFGIYCVIEIPMMLAAENTQLTAWFAAVNFPTKFLGCWWGALSAARAAAPKLA